MFDVCDVVGWPAPELIRTDRKAVGEASNTSCELVLLVLAHRLTVTRKRVWRSSKGATITLQEPTACLRVIHDRALVTGDQCGNDTVHQTVPLSVVWTVGRVDTAAGVGFRQTFVLHLHRVIRIGRKAHKMQRHRLTLQFESIAIHIIRFTLGNNRKTCHQ